MFFLIIYCVVAHQFKSDSKVLQLNGEQLENEIQKQTPFLVMLYAPWCGHCKNFIPILDELADQVNFKFIAIDCTIHTDVKKRFNVRGYPTVMLIKDNKSYKYQGQRTFELMTKFIETDHQDSKEINIIPIYEQFQENFIEKYFKNIWIFIAVIVLSILTLFVTFLCFKDFKENKQLDKMEQELNEQKKQQ